MELITGVAGEAPDWVKQGEAARLFPVLSENSKEGRAASVFLSTLAIVDTLAEALLGRIGRSLGKRARVNTYTEVVLKSAPEFRPDGLVVVDTSREIWSALVECKVGKARIEAEQLEAYLRIARENDINCVVTISNELVADPSHPPTVVDGRLTRTVKHYHFSWLAIRSEAEIAYSQALVTDPEKRFILAELIRFLSHPSAGVEGFGQMPSAWEGVITDIATGQAPSKHDPRLTELAGAWLQQEKELSLVLSRLVSRHCLSRTERRLRRSGFDPVLAAVEELASASSLSTELTVPDAASDISVVADLKGRVTRISMTLRAPEDRQRPEARVNWLLSQLKNADPRAVEVIAHWPGRARSTRAALSVLRENPKEITGANSGVTPYAFEVVQSVHSPASFLGRRRFVQELAAAIQTYYENIGRRLTAWAPRAPAPSAESAAEQIEKDTVIESVAAMPVDGHSAPTPASSPLAPSLPDTEAVATGVTGGDAVHHSQSGNATELLTTVENLPGSPPGNGRS